MDILQKAMEKENYVFTVETDRGVVNLFSKDYISSTVDENGNEVINYYWCIGETWDNGKDFSMHYIHSWNNVISWLNDNIVGGYESVLNEYTEKINQ